MRSLITLVVFILAVPASAEEVRVKPADVNSAIDRGLAFLVKDALAWKKEHNCVSCHHAGLMIWATREAKLRGHTVDEPVLAEMTSNGWPNRAARQDRRAATRRTAQGPQYLKAVYFALALGQTPSRTCRLAERVETHAGNGERRPDRRGAVASVARYAAAALRQFRREHDGALWRPWLCCPRPPVMTRRSRCVTRPFSGSPKRRPDDDPQSIALRLLLWHALPGASGRRC